MENVWYLEDTDFVQGALKPYVGKGKPVVVMAQGSYCGYCQTAKPAFQSLSKSPTLPKS